MALSSLSYSCLHIELMEIGTSTSCELLSTSQKFPHKPKKLFKQKNISMNCATHIDISSSLYWNDHFKMDLSQTYVTACALCNVCVCPCVSFEMTHMALPNILSFCFTTSCYVQHTINIFTHSLIAHHSNNFSYKGKYWFSHDRRLSDYHSQSHGIQLLWHIFHSTHSFSERPNRSSLQQCNINKKNYLVWYQQQQRTAAAASTRQTNTHTHRRYIGYWTRWNMMII